MPDNNLCLAERLVHAFRASLDEAEAVYQAAEQRAIVRGNMLAARYNAGAQAAVCRVREEINEYWEYILEEELK